MKHPAAYDPMLQDKIDDLCKNPQEYLIKSQIINFENNIEYQKRTLRAIKKEIENLEICLSSLREAEEILKRERENKESMDGDG